MKSKRSARQWTVERILNNILQLQEVSAKYAQCFHADLYSAAIRYFSTWRKAVEAAGFEYQKVSKRKLRGHWCRETILAEITQLAKKNSNHVRMYRRDLYSAAIRFFGSWKSAIEAAGFDYESIREDWIPSDSNKIRFRQKKDVLNKEEK
ncbi:MAG: hypothetical protein HYV97_15815 [Bdellovibrio sp.]|nr:hypothetical protein [Bdellovibrio sp.]